MDGNPIAVDDAQKNSKDENNDQTTSDEEKGSGGQSFDNDKTEAISEKKAKKFYLSSTDDEERESVKWKDKKSSEDPREVCIAESTTDLESGELSKTPTAVILSKADRKIAAAAAAKGKSLPRSAYSSRSISEVLRAKLSALPIREEGNFTLGGFKYFELKYIE